MTAESAFRQVPAPACRAVPYLELILDALARAGTRGRFCRTLVDDKDSVRDPPACGVCVAPGCQRHAVPGTTTPDEGCQPDYGSGPNVGLGT